MITKSNFCCLISAMLTLGTVVLAFGQPTSNNAKGVVTEGIYFYAESVHPKILVGQDVVLSVNIENRRSSDIAFLSTDPLIDFTAVVTDPEGKVVPLNAVGKQLMLYGGSSRRVKVVLHPGQNFQEYLILSSIYDFHLIGKYTIVVQHALPATDNHNSIDVKSNPVEVVVENKVVPAVENTTTTH
jgi:hypothetical protein